MNFRKFAIQSAWIKQRMYGATAEQWQAILKAKTWAKSSMETLKIMRKLQTVR